MNPSAASAPIRHTCWSLFTRCALLAFLTASLGAASPSLTLQISNETAPAGGTAQFKIFVTPPALVSTASVSMIFDPTIFGPIANVTAFSATGDQVGYASVNGQQLTAGVSSPSASLGQLPELPIFVVTVPILASAKSAATSAITVDPTQSPWQDHQGNTYTVSVNPGSFTVGGTLSIQSVTPGGGLLPAGTVVSVNGAGFDSATTATIDGVAIASTQFVSAQQISLALGGATELTGKHLHVKTGAAEQSDFFCSLDSAPANTASTIFPLLPLTTYTNVTWQYVVEGAYSYSVALQNQTLSPVTVTFFYIGSAAMVSVAPSITIPPGELYWLNPSTYGPSLGTVAMLTSAPIRMLEAQTLVGPPPRLFPPTLLSANEPPLAALLQPTAYPSAATWTWQIGTAAPSPMTIDLTGGLPITATISNAPWLTASAPQGQDPMKLTLTPNVSALGAGSYSGTVTIHTVFPPSLSVLSVPDTVIPVSIQVSPSPFIKALGTGYFTATPGSVTPGTGTISVSSSGAAAQFSVSTNASWLSVTPTTGTTPGSITVSVNPSGLATGTYMGNVVIQGPANSVTVSEEFVIAPAPPVGPPPLSVNPASLNFALPAGTAQPQAPQLVFVQPTFDFTIAVQTQSGGNWLTAVFIGGVSVTASAVGLNPGTYLGTITLASPNNGSVQIPVTLVVLAPAAPLTVTPSSVALTAQPGQSVSQSFHVTSSPNTLFNSPTFTPGAEQWVIGGSTTSPYTPSTVTLNFMSSQPGTHYGSVTFTSGSGSVVVPIMLGVTASAELPPILASVVNAASGIPSAISPGEIVSLYGTGLGSEALIDNVSAPVLYASAGQVNAIVPFETGTAGAATVQLAGSLPTTPWSVPLAPSAPSVFALNGSGVGPGAVVNQDGSINSSSNPAARGTVIQIYATGGGQTTPASSTGTVAPAAASLILPVTVTIGGVNAQVLYAGNAPGELEGVVQINAIVPPTAASGNVVVTIGGVTSQPGVTVAIF